MGFDITSAFNQTKLPPNVNIYVRLPKILFPNTVICKMLSAMNGIAEASAEFFELMATIFKSIGYKQTCGDKAFWYKRIQDHF